MAEAYSKKIVVNVCPIDVQNLELLDLLKNNYRCQIIYNAWGNENHNGEDVLYIFSDFESELFKNFVVKWPEKPIISSTMVQCCHRQGLPLPVPRPRRPLYCDMFKKYDIVIRAGNLAEKLSLCSIVQYMGGHLKREPNANTSFVITSRARGKAFRQSVSLGQRVLLPSWLYECWAHRDDLSFDPESAEIIAKHRIGVFERLRIFMYGFDDDEAEDMKHNIIENRGSIVEDVSQATHCVINTSAVDIRTFPPLEHQRLVTNEWVWTSITIQHCANEESYHPGAAYSQNLAMGSLASTRIATAHSCVAEESGDKVQKKSKAYQVCVEIYETDVSYVNALKLLLEVKEQLDLLVDQGIQLIQKSEVALIFGKISPIVAVHKEIIVRLKNLLDNWKSDADVAQVWIDAFEELNRIYAPYSNTYDTAVDTLVAADKANLRLHAFLRSKECSKEFKRNSFKDLLIRPVQRIPTLIVLLKELEKRSERKSDKIKEAIDLMDRVVSRANDVRAQNDDFIQQLSFFNEVEDVPRKVLKSVDAFSLCGTLEWQNLSRRKVKIILYNDLIMIVKVRTSREMTGALNRLAGRASFSGLSERKRQLKYFAHLLIPHVREINRLKLFNYDGTVNDRLEPSGGPQVDIVAIVTMYMLDTVLLFPWKLFTNVMPVISYVLPIYSWTVRDVSSDAYWYIEAINKCEMFEFVEEVHKKIFMDFGRDVQWPGFVISDVPTSCIHDVLVKHVKKMMPKKESSVENSGANRSSTFSAFRRRSASGLRRTMSHIGSITRRSIPSAFRSSDMSATSEGDRNLISKPLSLLTLSSDGNFESSLSQSAYGKDIVGSVLDMVEESDQEVFAAAECSDKEN